MVKSTKGSWFAHQNHDGRWEVLTSIGSIIKSITGWGCITQSKSDAKLLASAPDLLDSLREALKEIEEHNSKANFMEYHHITPVKTIIKWKSLISNIENDA